MQEGRDKPLEPEIVDSVEKAVLIREEIRQKTESDAIAAADRQHEREIEFSEREMVRADKRWKIAFGVAATIVVVLLVFSIYLVCTGDKEHGFSLLTHSATTMLGFIAGFGISKIQQDL